TCQNAAHLGPRPGAARRFVTCAGCPTPRTCQNAAHLGPRPGAARRLVTSAGCPTPRTDQNAAHPPERRAPARTPRIVTGPAAPRLRTRPAAPNQSIPLPKSYPHSSSEVCARAPSYFMVVGMTTTPIYVHDHQVRLRPQLLAQGYTDPEI